MGKDQEMQIPFFPYRLFFLYIEPVSALAGAFYAAYPVEYLSLITLDAKPESSSMSTSKPTLVPMETSISLYQLANLYLLFALNEHIVLSSTNSVKTWRRLLFCLLVADIGHLVTMYPLGLAAYWRFWEWNAMLWGSVAFVYVGASMRLAFLLGIGLRNRNAGDAGSGNGGFTSISAGRNQTKLK